MWVIDTVPMLYSISLYHGTAIVIFLEGQVVYKCSEFIWTVKFVMLSNKWKGACMQQALWLHCTNQIRVVEYLQAVVMDIYESPLKSVYHGLLKSVWFGCFGGKTSYTSACFSKSAVQPSKGADESVVKQSAYSQRQSFGQENGKRQKVYSTHPLEDTNEQGYRQSRLDPLRNCTEIYILASQPITVSSSV